MKGPLEGSASVVGHDCYLAASQCVLLSRHAGSRLEQREQMSDTVPEVKNEPVTDAGWMMQAWCKTHLSGNLKTGGGIAAAVPGKRPSLPLSVLSSPPLV